MATQVTMHLSVQKKKLDALGKVIVAYDFTEAADHALIDAMALSWQFHAEIVITHVESSREKVSGVQCSRELGDPVRVEMEKLMRRVALAGHPCKEIIRSGDVAKILAEIVQEERADLLLLGAYGDGPKDRETLGKNTEQLLRSIPCPVLTYGPKMIRSLFQSTAPSSILVPIELPCDPSYLIFAVSVAKLFKAKLEVSHVVDLNRALSAPDAFQAMQYTCEEIATYLRGEGVTVAGSLLFGDPDASIVLRSEELRSSFILMPLETRQHLSSVTSDNVAANIIRNAEVPVMTYRIDYDQKASDQ